MQDDVILFVRISGNALGFKIEQGSGSGQTVARRKETQRLGHAWQAPQ
jgi:hypothetical protein